MGQLTITLPDDLERQIREHVASSNYSSVSDFIREIAAKASSGLPTYWERANLAHLMEIERLLGADTDEIMLDALKHGYSKFYNKADFGASREEMPEDEMEFVMQVLEMYRDLQHSYRESKTKDPVIESAILFEGFDGNANDGYLGFLQFLVRHDRYTTVQPLDKGHAINSHSSITAPMYKSMLVSYKKVRQNHRNEFNFEPLTFDEVKAVIDTQTNPEIRE